ncbi:MAG: nuclear transport factor 2 family protein [Oceanicaulis sp.]
MKQLVTAAACGLLTAAAMTTAAAADDHTPTEVVSGIYEAFAAGDPEAFAAALHPEIIWNEAEGNTYADGNPYEGPQAVMEGVIGRVVTEWDGFTATPEEMIAQGDRVVVLGRYTGAYAATGKPINAQMVHVWTVQDGQAIRFQQYVDTLQLSEAEHAN